MLLTLASMSLTSRKPKDELADPVYVDEFIT